jgi:hypothetical protein
MHIVLSVMEKLLEKLSRVEYEDTGTANVWDDWSLEEQKKLLEIYLIISKKENHIFKLIYDYHGCDSWEDIFRDYDRGYLKDKTDGVKIAIDEIELREDTRENTK